MQSANEQDYDRASCDSGTKLSGLEILFSSRHYVLPKTIVKYIRV